jgi:hypothetical protein
MHSPSHPPLLEHSNYIGRRVQLLIMQFSPTLPAYIYTVFTVQAYQTSQYVVPWGGIFLYKWRSSFSRSSDGEINVQSACALNTRYILTFYGNRRT